MGCCAMNGAALSIFSVGSMTPENFIRAWQPPFARHVIAKVFLAHSYYYTYVGSVYHIVHVGTYHAEAVSTRRNLFERTQVLLVCSLFALIIPTARESALEPSLAFRHLRSAVAASYINHPRLKQLIFIIRSGATGSISDISLSRSTGRSLINGWHYVSSLLDIFLRG